MADKAPDGQSNALKQGSRSSSQELAWIKDTEQAIARLIEKEFLVRSGHRGSVNSVAFSPDGARLVSGSHDETVKVWDARSGRLLQTLEGHCNVVASVALSPEGARLASGSDDKTVRVWDLRSGCLLQTLEGHRGGVTSVAFSPEGVWLSSGSYDHTVKLWEVRSGRLLQTLEGHRDR
ncbi:MAG: WD40 repeat domain-containing protein, partial [Candidatus Dormibacteraceae bacterium]